MAKANITLPSGAKVTVEGSPGEVSDILKTIASSSTHSQSPRSSKKSRASAGKRKRRLGPTDRVRSLIEQGFFKEKRALPDILKKLEEGGHIYEMEDLSPVLVRLTRGHELRRVQDKRGWLYVNS